MAPTRPAPPAAPAEYLIFELADGDIRAHLEDCGPDVDVAFILRILHNVAVGLEQLHSAAMAHQDLKPSNVLIFSEMRGSKISDLGRAWAQEIAAPHDGFKVAGDRGYAPPELSYNAPMSDVAARRFGCDLYHFGSMVVFIFAGVHVNALLWKHLTPEHRPFTWGGSFNDVLPYLKAAFGSSLQEFESNVPEYLRPELVELVRWLCEPDPAQRGHPTNRATNIARYSLNRYITILDRLTYETEGRTLRKQPTCQV